MSGSALAQPPLLARRQLDRQRADDLLHHFVLGREDVGQLAIEPVGPEMPAAPGIDELGGDAYAIAGLADAALEHEPHAELAADLLHLDRLALVGEGGVPRDHEQAGDLRKIGDQVLGHAVAEILLLGIAAHVGEWQHGDRRLVRHRRRRCHGSGAVRPADAEDPHRPGDVLDRPFAQIFQHDLQLVAHRIAHGARDEDRARFGDALQPRRNVDPVSVDVVAFDDDVAQVDADAELDAAVFGRGAVAVGHAGLDRDGAAHGLDRAGEIHQQAVAGALDDASLVHGDARLDELAKMLLEPAKRAFLVVAHEPAITGDVSRQDRCELAFGVLVFHRVAPSSCEPSRPIR